MCCRREQSLASAGPAMVKSSRVGKLNQFYFYYKSKFYILVMTGLLNGPL